MTVLPQGHYDHDDDHVIVFLNAVSKGQRLKISFFKANIGLKPSTAQKINI